MATETSGSPGLGRVRRSDLPYVNVTLSPFNAVGDGVADDTVAIESAVNYCLNSGRDLFFPAGSYLYAPAATKTVGINAAGNLGFRLFGEGNNSKILLNANGVIFDVLSNIENPLYLDNLSFVLQTPATNSAATLFYISNTARAWGGRVHVQGCYFEDFTYATFHGIKLTNSSFRDSHFKGSNTDGAFSLYDDAGIRLWGGVGDSSDTPSFSNQIVVELCTFRFYRYGAEVISGSGISFATCTFDPCWVGIIARPSAAGNAYGTIAGTVALNACWFEEQAGHTSKWYFTNRNIDYATGNDVDSGLESSFTSVTPQFLLSATYIKDSAVRTARSEAIEATKNGKGVDLATSYATHPFFAAKGTNPSATFYNFTPTVAYIQPQMLVGANASQRYVGSPGGAATVYTAIGIEGIDTKASLSVIRNSASASGPFITLAKSRGATVGSNTIVQSGDKLGTIEWAGADGVDLFSVAASIFAEVDGTPGSNDMPARLIMATTADGAQSPTERLRITSAGDIHTPAGATDMAGGFIRVPAAAGTPTGTPAAVSGTAPLYVDTTANKLYFYSSGAWRDAGP